MISIATWNVNSVKVRLPQLLGWLKADHPDIVLLQEIKCLDEAFPAMEIEELGYNIATHGQKTYNGVAILSKFPLEDIRRGLPGNDDTQSRYIEAVVSLPKQLAAGNRQLAEKRPDAMRVASVYVPNGQTADSDKFQYKLQFLDRLHAHMKTLLSYGEMLAVGGDYNIAPEDRDVHDPKRWEGSVLTHDEVRREFRRLLALGMQDGWRLASLQKDREGYSWWDYRTGAYERNDGLRIDHLLLSPQAADMLQECAVRKELRALEKASDHAPVLVTLGIGD